MVDYVLEGPRWGTGAAGTSGGTVTWAISSSVPASFVSDIQAAFSDWSSHANIKFQQVASTSNANVSFGDSYIDGLNNVLGSTKYAFIGSQLNSASIIFDSGEGWHASGNQIVSNSGVNLSVVALHEIGHALGLDHYNAASAVMNAYLNTSVADLKASDIDGIQALYGAAQTATVAGASAATSAIAGNATASAAAASLFGSVTHDSHSLGGQVYALYEAVLGRAPDLLGLEGFNAGVQAGASLTDVAGALLAAPERAGNGTDPTTFVQSLYTNVLHRSADTGGLQFFTGELSAGVSQATVAVQIATSAEAQADLAPTFQTGVFVPDAIDAGVARLYYGLLGRAPDAGGLQAFEAQVRTAAASGGYGGALQGLANATGAILSSPEYTASHAGQTDAAFVDSLYVGALGRHADSGGASYYGGELAQSVSRAVVALQIAESPEAQVHLVGVIEQGFHLAG